MTATLYSDLALEITDDDLLNGVSIPSAIESVTRRRPAPPVCSRHTRRGIAGIVLPSWVVGGRRLTSPRLVKAWIAETTLRVAEVKQHARKLNDSTEAFLDAEGA